jgi:glycerophosphoryl diester phosphodiesterase
MTLKESVALQPGLTASCTRPSSKRAIPTHQRHLWQPGEVRAEDDRRAQGRWRPPQDVFAQSFNKDDILYWIQHEPQFGKQAVYLDSIDPTATPLFRG